MTDVKDMVLRRYSNDRLMAEVERRGLVVERIKNLSAMSLLAHLREACHREAATPIALLEREEIIEYVAQYFGMYTSEQVSDMRAVHADEKKTLALCVARLSLSLQAAAALLRKTADQLSEAAKHDTAATDR